MRTIPWRYREVKKEFAAGPFPAWLLYGVGLIAVVNFAVFFLSTLFLGGDALTGYQASGRYYLGSRSQLTEVSREVYQYSLWQTRSVFVTHPLAMAVWAIALTRRNRLGQF